MDYRTTRGTSGLSRIPQSRYLTGETFDASNSRWTGFFLTQKRSQVGEDDQPSVEISQFLLQLLHLLVGGYEVQVERYKPKLFTDLIP